MSNNKVKISGYAKRVFFDSGIEYRNFNPDLVGVQLTSDGGTPLFTMGNFSITTNMESKSDKIFTTNNFSNFITLTNLDLSIEQTSILLADNANVILNLNKSNLNYYSLFGSLSEFIRVSLEEIITKWPASLYITPLAQSNIGHVLNGFTYQNYLYNPLTEISTFKIDTTFINNKFQINYLTNGVIINTFNATNDIRNLTVNYNSYVIYINNIEYPIVGFTGSTTQSNDYIYFTVKGNPFINGINGNIFYHIKPNNSIVDQFFNHLTDFENYLLNRQLKPIYTSIFKYPIKSDEGVILYVTDTITWPVSDGYNIDFDTSDYVTYASKLFDLSTANDLYKSDLMNRFLVSESISDFDTMPVHLGPLDQDTSGRKMNKTLHIYGREFDDINNFISGIAFAHTVTYDKQDNTPDVYLKNLASVLGWELVSSILETNLLSNYVTKAPSTYSGQTVGLTPVEADNELWRRLILNTPWIWKSKGARKSIEFLLKFIGAPLGLVQFNEYIYKATAPIDIELFKSVLYLNNLDTDISLYPIDSNGYPSPLPDTLDMYFQNNGLWYRETGGSNASIDILTGNNPHLGPYDGGFKYINQFATLIPNFSPVTVSSSTSTNGSTNLFINYGLGLITNYSGATYVDGVYSDGTSLSDCIIITTTIIPDPMPSDYISDCGCASSTDDDSLSICIDINENLKNLLKLPCDNVVGTPKPNSNGIYSWSKNQYDISGNLLVNTQQTIFINPDCCTINQGVPWLINEYDKGVLINTGYICCVYHGNCGCNLACSWVLNNQPIIYYPPTQIDVDNQYLQFIDENGLSVVVTPDGCNCVANLTIAVPNIIDPNTGQIGYGCKITTAGLADIMLGTNGELYNTYYNRSNGTFTCSEVYNITR